MNGIIEILRVKWQILKNKLSGLRRESRFKMAVIALFILGYGAGSFWALFEGFNYINEVLGFGFILIDRLFYVFFMVLFFMLATSQFIITYSSFYKSGEVEYLFSMPVRHTAVYAVKFFEAVFLSSWAFLFLSVPLFLAYGAARGLGPSFYLAGIGLSIPFIFITAGIGTGLCVVLVRNFPKRFFRVIVLSVFIAVVVLFLYYKKARQGFNWETTDLGLVLDELLKHTKASLFPFLPSYWVTKGLLSAVYKDFGNAAFYFLVLLSSAIFFVWLCMKAGEKLYFPGWQILNAGQWTRQYIPRFHWGKGKICALVSKDLKLFYRDPVQWSQFAIFFGILGVYIFNLRSMRYDIESVFWKNMISWLNMGTIALTLGTLCTRFIYPQMSMEAKRMWIIGLTPAGIGRILLVKYVVSICLCSIISAALIAGSNIMLKVPPDMAYLSFGTIFFMSLSLPGLALGLGAVFPNIKEDDMAHIVAGFGGTLTLVLSLLYITGILIITIFLKWIFLIIGISVLTACLPLFAGYRCLLKMEI